MFDYAIKIIPNNKRYYIEEGILIFNHNSSLLENMEKYE